MDTEEFNDYVGKQQKAEREAKYGKDEETGMFASRESARQSKALEEHWNNQPDPDDYNGPF